MSAEMISSLDGRARKRSGLLWYIKPVQQGDIKPEFDNERAPVYGSVFFEGENELSIDASGGSEPVAFSGRTKLSGLYNEPGKPEIIISRTGDYEIGFVVYFYSDVSSKAAFSIEVNGQALPGGTFERDISIGSQSVSGSTMAALAAGDSVRLVFSSKTAAGIRFAGEGVLAVMSVIMLG